LRTRPRAKGLAGHLSRPPGDPSSRRSSAQLDRSAMRTHGRQRRLTPSAIGIRQNPRSRSHRVPRDRLRSGRTGNRAPSVIGGEDGVRPVGRREQQCRLGSRTVRVKSPRRICGLGSGTQLGQESRMRRRSTSEIASGPVISAMRRCPVHEMLNHRARPADLSTANEAYVRRREVYS